jgi:hypothetical protein
MPLAEITAGGGLGLLVGLLVALSVSPVVGSVISALTVLLAGFFGLAPSGGPDRAWRIGAFGLACVIGVVAGLALRNGDWFSPSLERQSRDWQRAGATSTEAAAYLAYQRLGIKPPGREAGEIPKPAARDTVLFAGVTDLCGQLHGVDGTPQRLRILRQAGAPYDALAAAAESAQGATGDSLAAAMKSLCGY